MISVASVLSASVGRLFRHLHFGSIKGKIFVVFAVTILSTAALTGLNHWNLSLVMERMLLSESYDDLLNNILEVRRFEKNYLIYEDVGSIAESNAYLDRIDGLSGSLRGDLTDVVGAADFGRFVIDLKEYRECVARVAAGESAPQDRLRVLGKELLDSAERFRRIKRERIHDSIQRTAMLPFAFLAIVLLLMILVIKLIANGLLRPLDAIRDMTGVVARGDFSPIHYDGVPLEEMAGLIDAFNRMARELESNQEDLLQARKIAAIGTFTAGIAHELNNPINNISLTAEAFAEEYGNSVSKEGREMLRDIMSQSERAADIVKNLLDFSRTESPVFECLRPGRILSSTVNLVKNQVHVAGQRLEFDVPDDLPCVQGNLRNLQQVFTNLLLNAIQATPSGGLIRVGADWDEANGQVRMRVTDSGPGVPVGIRQQIFEPFFSTKEVGKGTGLGLAVSYSLVKRHGGRIEVHGEAGQGAEFRVLLPVSKRPGAAREGDEA